MHPVAYFLQNKCSAAIQAQLIRDCICLPYDEGLLVHALIVNGTYINQDIGKKLGCSFTVNNFQTWFAHPAKVTEKIHLIFDACHMLKLMWNLLVDYKDITFMENGQAYKVSWKYIVDLNDVQESTGFKLATNLRGNKLIGQNTE